MDNLYWFAAGCCAGIAAASAIEGYRWSLVVSFFACGFLIVLALTCN